MNPTIGRLLHYKLPSGPSVGQTRPAIVVREWGNDYCVNLQVFLDQANDGAVPTYVTSAIRADSEYGKGIADGLGCWSWPPRV